MLLLPWARVKKNLPCTFVFFMSHYVCSKKNKTLSLSGWLAGWLVALRCFVVLKAGRQAVKSATMHATMECRRKKDLIFISRWAAAWDIYLYYYNIGSDRIGVSSRTCWLVAMSD